ncbi:MAG TPA: aminotransferase class III-fold pyridoxal phosphate-dependent enzyme [Gemmatimonadales bacterium]|nr:aminotransferase class III-fold pyridoxal phosphate-dependent enzyme [Gemmatimonadales bacterium]
MKVAGFTSTGSKRPAALFGDETFPEGVPLRMRQSAGCRAWDEDGREFLDFIMALGAVALGYGHPDVTRAAVEAAERGGIGPLAPVEEEQLAAELGAIMPGLEQVRFLKTGAEAVAAAVRLARVATGRDRVLGCGYHGWLDWCSRGPGVPAAVQVLYRELPFNDPDRTIALIREIGDALACVVVEPVVDAEPDRNWLSAIREETRRLGAVLVFDEIKTGFRVALGGAAARWGGEPDLVVLGKALANGYPLAAVGGRSELMQRVGETWISSTLATEFIAFAAARATLRVVREQNLPLRLAETGGRLYDGLSRLAGRFPARMAGVGGIPEMCYLRFADAEFGARVARECACRGLLFKRSPYNFVSLAHRGSDVDQALATLEEVLGTLPVPSDRRTARPPHAD